MWLVSAFVLVDRMTEADIRGADIRAQLLRNEHLLSTVSTQVLLSAVYLRDTLFDPSPDRRAPFDRQLRESRALVEEAIKEFVPAVESEEERRHWAGLQRELAGYWASMPQPETLSAVRGPAEALSLLRGSVIPRREAIIRLAAEIHELGRQGLEREQAALAQQRRLLRRRIWQISSAAALLGIGIAFVAARYAGQLEATIRDQHARDIHQKQELERLSSRLMAAQEVERRRIARELHDDVGQALSAIKLELASVGRQPDGSVNGQALDEARAITDHAIQAVRDVSQLLHPSTLDDLGLPDTVDWYLKGFARRSEVRSTLNLEGLSDPLPQDVSVCAYRVIQEATTNIARHSGATSCRVTLAQRPGWLEVVIEDDGMGFDPAAPGGRGLGLVSVRERVAGLGGHTKLDSRPGRGTRLAIELPIPRDAHDDTQNSDC